MKCQFLITHTSTDFEVFCSHLGGQLGNTHRLLHHTICLSLKKKISLKHKEHMQGKVPYTRMNGETRGEKTQIFLWLLVDFCRHGLEPKMPNPKHPGPINYCLTDNYF